MAGKQSGRASVEQFLLHLGGLRITLPGMATLAGNDRFVMANISGRCTTNIVHMARAVECQ